jgi:hypothetical protein
MPFKLSGLLVQPPQRAKFFITFRGCLLSESLLKAQKKNALTPPRWAISCDKTCGLNWHSPTLT